MEINCSRYSERIIDIINLFHELGWDYYDAEKTIEYLPLGDDDSFDWQKRSLSEKKLQELINNKQNAGEQIGLVLYYENSGIGVTLLAKNTKEISLDINIHRKTVDKSRESITDISWYFTHIICGLKDRKCPVDYIKIVDYTD